MAIICRQCLLLLSLKLIEYDSTSKKYLIFCEIYFATCSFPQFPEKEINIFDGGVIWTGVFLVNWQDSHIIVLKNLTLIH